MATSPMPTLRRPSSLDSGPPLASPKSSNGLESEPTPSDPACKGPSTPLTSHAGSLAGAGTDVQSEGKTPLSQKHGSDSC
eukprot:5102334-Pyramimonas_sp.AAC.1